MLIDHNAEKVQNSLGQTPKRSHRRKQDLTESNLRQDHELEGSLTKTDNNGCITRQMSKKPSEVKSVEETIQMPTQRLGGMVGNAVNCIHCFQICKSKFALRKHMEKFHKGAAPLKRRYPSVNMSVRASLNLLEYAKMLQTISRFHEKRQEFENGLELCCRICFRVFKSYSRFLSHFSRVHLYLYKCHHCWVGKPTMRLLRWHMKRSHHSLMTSGSSKSRSFSGSSAEGARKRHKCPHCTSVFLHASNLKVHLLKTVVRKYHRNWRCEEAGCSHLKKFRSCKALRSHMTMMHPDVMYVCPHDLCKFSTRLKPLFSK